MLMSDDQVRQLRRNLATIHSHFAGLYNPAAGEPYAMEIEFKITSENILAIKQARPWVFSGAATPPTRQGGNSNPAVNATPGWRGPDRHPDGPRREHLQYSLAVGQFPQRKLELGPYQRGCIG